MGWGLSLPWTNWWRWESKERKLRIQVHNVQLMRKTSRRKASRPSLLQKRAAAGCPLLPGDTRSGDQDLPLCKMLFLKQNEVQKPGIGLLPRHSQGKQSWFCLKPKESRTSIGKEPLFEPAPGRAGKELSSLMLQWGFV